MFVIFNDETMTHYGEDGAENYVYRDILAVADTKEEAENYIKSLKKTRWDCYDFIEVKNIKEK